MLLVTAKLLAAGSNDDRDWVGVWHGELDGQPSVALTLANDTGDLGGTLVLNIISRDGGSAHVIASEPHTLIHPHVDGEELAFSVKRPDGELMKFAVALNPEGMTTIHCLNCGANAPVVVITKAQ
jgi:hypothetical protein